MEVGGEKKTKEMKRGKGDRMRWKNKKKRRRKKNNIKGRRENRKRIAEYE